MSKKSKVKKAEFVHDPKVHCPHQWQYLDQEDGRRKDFERVCVTCGAGSTRNERKQVIAYDRDWNFGEGRSDVREDDSWPENHIRNGYEDWDWEKSVA